MTHVHVHAWLWLWGTIGVVWWGVDVVVGVVFPVFWVQHRTWRAVWGVGVVDMVRLCFPIATYSMYMGMGGGAGGTPVARLGGCGLCAWGLPHTSSVREVRGSTCRYVGVGCGCLPPFNLCFRISPCIMSSRMRSGGNLMWWAWRGGVLTWWWGSFSLGFVCKTGPGVLHAGLVQWICTVYVFQ